MLRLARIFSVLLGAVIVSAESIAASPDPCLFDADGDGIVSQDDIERLCFPFDGYFAPQCDLDGNGVITFGETGFLYQLVGSLCAAVPSLSNLSLVVLSLLAGVLGILFMRRARAGGAGT